MARPAKIKYTKTLWRKICAEIASGRSVIDICSNDENAPSEGIFYYWLTNKCDSEEFLRYQRARESQAHALFDRLPGWIMDDAMDPGRLSARAKAVEIHAKRCAPKFYGDRQEIGLSGGSGGPVQIVTAIPEPDPSWGSGWDGEES